jgi:hypothetical protein
MFGAVVTPARVLAIAAALAVAIGVVGMQLLRTPAAPLAAEPRNGSLTIDSRPDNLEVVLDGEARGTTPLILSVAPGLHTLAIRDGRRERVVPLAVAAGAQITQYLEMPAADAGPASGALVVSTEPPGARVSVDGRLRGASPVTIADLSAGDHQVSVAGSGGSFERTVRIAPGATSSLVFSLAKTSGPVGGWLAVKAPFELEVVEHGDVIGTSGASRIMLAAGRHDVVLTNRSVGYEDARTIEVAAGSTTTIGVEPPLVPVSVNARPWAEITLDGASLGQTPIANMLVSLGTHEVVFRHPELAEHRQTVVVTAKGPNRIAADLTK